MKILKLLIRSFGIHGGTEFHLYRRIFHIRHVTYPFSFKKRGRKGSGELVNAFVIIMAILTIMLVAVATFMAFGMKQEKIIFDEVEIMRTKNTFYLTNRSIGVTWFISTVQTIFKAENSIGEPYWYKTDPARAKAILLPDAALCNSGNPRICLPRTSDIAAFLKSQMTGYLGIKDSLDLNSVKVKIENIDIEKPNNFWTAYDRITSLVTQRLTAEFGATKSADTTHNNNAIFTKFRKMATAGWLVVGLAVRFSKEAEQHRHDYTASVSNYIEYLANKERYADSGLKDIKEWLMPDAASVFSKDVIELRVPEARKTDGSLPAQSGLLLHYDLGAAFTEGISTGRCVQNTAYDNYINEAINERSWEFCNWAHVNCNSFSNEEIKALVKSIINQESGWNQNTGCTEAGGCGLMQITRMTANGDCSDYGGWNAMTEPRANIRCGVKVLNLKFSRIKCSGPLDRNCHNEQSSNDLRYLAVAAYNGGEGLIRKAIELVNGRAEWGMINNEDILARACVATGAYDPDYCPAKARIIMMYVQAVMGCYSYYIGYVPGPIGTYEWPVPSGHTITSCFGDQRDYDMHTAIDIAATRGDEVRAVTDGRVVRTVTNCREGDVSCGGRYGNHVLIRHDSDAYYSQYSHLSSVNVQSGSNVRRGDKIGEIGSTGYSTGPHLDLEIKTAETSGHKNPCLFVNCQGQCGISQPPPGYVTAENLYYKHTGSSIDNKMLFGINNRYCETYTGCTPSDRQKFDALKQAGMSTLSVAVGWEYIEPSRGSSYRFADYDSQINSIVNDRIIPKIAFCCWPQWARSGQISDQYCCIGDEPRRTQTCTPLNTVYENDFKRTVGAVVERYKDKVKYYEFEIEPDCRGWEPAVYARWLRLFGEAVHSADRSAVVITGGLRCDENAGNYVAAYYDGNAQNSFDAVALHPYGSPLNYDCINSARNAMVSKGDSGKKIWITEWGINSRIGEQRQAELIGQGLDYLSSQPFIAAAYYHNFECELTRPNCMPGDSEHLGFDLLRGDGSKKPSYYEFQAKATGSNERFEKAPFTLNVKVSDYLPVLKCSENNNKQYNWLTEKDMLCYGNNLYTCTRSIIGLQASNIKNDREMVGSYKCLVDAGPRFCKQGDDTRTVEKCCKNWPAAKDGTFCSGFCAGDGLCDRYGESGGEGCKSPDCNGLRRNCPGDCCDNVVCDPITGICECTSWSPNGPTCSGNTCSSGEWGCRC